MSESPYAPPKAAVADVEPQHAPLQRPRQVTWAVNCLWASLAVGMVSGFANLAKTSGGIPLAFTAVILAVTFLISAVIYYYIAKGRNWARIVYIVFAAISIISVPVLLIQINAGATNVVHGGIALVNLGVGYYVCYLLLTKPAREWFRGMKARS